MNTSRFRGVISWLWLILWTCTAPLSHAASVKAGALHPPAQPIQGIQRVAVLAFDGTVGIAASDAFGRWIHLHERQWSETDGDPALVRKGLDVVERIEFDRLVDEQFRSLSGLLDTQTAARVGKMAGVDALIIGSTTMDLNRGTQEYSELDITSSGREVERKRRRHTLSISLRIDARMLEAETGTMIAALQGEADTLILRDKPEELKNTAIWSELLVESASARAVSTLFPAGESYSIPLEDGRDLRSVNSALRDGRLDEACAELLPMLDKDPYNPELLYTRGVIRELGRDFEPAAADYGAAHGLKPGNRTSDARERASRLAGETLELANAGFPFERHSCPGSGSPAVKAVVNPWYIVRVDRAACRAEPNSTLAPMFTLPKKVRFEAIEVKAGWVRGRLHDGREVWLVASDLRRED